MTSPNADLEVALDQCVDLLIAGGDWTMALPEDPQLRERLIPLMHSAERVMATRDAVPALGAGRRRRIREAAGRLAMFIRSVVLDRLPRLPSTPPGTAA